MKNYCALLLGLSLFSIALSQDDEPSIQPVEFPSTYVSELNTVYTKIGDWEGKMDIYRPGTSDRPVPIVINIHGGAWTHGAKEEQRGFGSFFKNRFAVANIEYRMSPIAPAPAAIEDARCALLYVVRNAKRLNIDPNRIVLMGGSAGGHLALMAGLMGYNPTFDKNCAGTDTFRVAAIVDKYGIVEVKGCEQLLRGKSAKAWLKGYIDDDAFLHSISPAAYLTRKAPPVFIVHGDADKTVPYTQSVELHKKLDELGVPNEFVTVPGGLHGKFTKEKNSEISAAMWTFLNKHIEGLH